MQSMLVREALYTLDGRVEVDDAYLVGPANLRQPA